MSACTPATDFHTPPRLRAAPYVTRGARGTSTFVFNTSKLSPPQLRHDAIRRPGLVNRLRAARETSVVVVSGPAGYGKSTLLALWAERETRDVAWLSLDEEDTDPKRFLAYLALALGRIQPVEIGMFERLASPSSSATAVAAQLGAALASCQDDVVIVLDDAHVLGKGAVDVLRLVIAHLPAGSTVALGTRSEPALPLARLRAEGRLLEIGPDDLRLTEREAASVLAAAGIELREPQVERLAARTEGWAAGIYLGGLSLRVQGTTDGTSFGGADRFVTDYFQLEVLGALAPATVEFLTRASVLERMSGALCDTVLGTTGSARRLGTLEQANAFVVPLDRERRWYRLHRLFRETLREELERREPALVPELVRRASIWCEAHGDVDGAVEYAAAARDTERLVDLVGASAPRAYVSGGEADVEQWLARIDDGVVLARHPSVAVVGATMHALAGRRESTDRWLRAAGSDRRNLTLPDGSRPAAWRAIVAAATCRDGVDEMASSAGRALDGLAAGSVLTPTAHLLRGVAEYLRSRLDEADAALAAAWETAEAVGASQTACIALAERSLVAGAGGTFEESERLALLARDVAREAGLVDDPSSAIAFAASARSALRNSNWPRAHDDIARARSLVSGHAPSWLAVQLRVELADLYLALGDADDAEALMVEVDEQPGRGRLGVVTRAARTVRQRLAERKADEGRPTMLTGAELRLLPFLSTHLSFPEIADRLFVSRNTVKAQAISVYRKLGVSSRSDAIGRAVELGLMTVRSVGESTAA
jgi:LuxR family transcriptional regulator, maltose regulon positive regulatory protein